MDKIQMPKALPAPPKRAISQPGASEPQRGERGPRPTRSIPFLPIAISIGVLALIAVVGVRLLKGPRGASENERSAAPTKTIEIPAKQRSSIETERKTTDPQKRTERSRNEPSRIPEEGASRTERNAFTVASYLEWAKYPPTSRPLAERPDRKKPHSQAPRSLPLGKDSKVRAILWQSHVYLAGREQATFRIACRNGDEPVHCNVHSATLSAEAEGAGLPEVAIPFSGDLSASVSPFEVGFANYSGPLLLHVLLENTEVTFALLYTAVPPATFTGVVRETVDQGSLNICVGMNVREAGRYVLDGRVDDAKGTPFAFVSFNEELEAGMREVCFVVFGKLIVDESEGGPFTLHDVEGFLLKENAFPDRLSLPTWEGVVHKTAPYPLEQFSTNEYESEAKSQRVSALRGADPSSF